LALGPWLLALGFWRLTIRHQQLAKKISRESTRKNANHVFSVSDSCLFAKFAAKLLSYLRLSAEIAYHRKSAALFLWLNADC
jgi:hypothetical protein